MVKHKGNHRVTYFFAIFFILLVLLSITGIFIAGLTGQAYKFKIIPKVSSSTPLIYPIELCTDGKDNDDDKLVDCEDPDCQCPGGGLCIDKKCIKPCPTDNNPKAVIFMPNPALNPVKTCVSLKNLVNQATLDGKNVKVQYVCEKKVGKKITINKDFKSETISVIDLKTCSPNFNSEDFIPGNTLNEYATQETNFLYPGPEVYNSYKSSDAMKFDLLSAYYYADHAAEFWKDYGWDNSNYKITITLASELGASSGKEIHMNPSINGKKGDHNSAWDLFPMAHEVGHSVHISKSPVELTHVVHIETITEFFAKYTEIAILNMPNTETYFSSPGFDFSKKWTNEETLKSLDCKLDINKIDFNAQINENNQCGVMTLIFTLTSTLWELRNTIGVDETNKLVFETMGYDYSGLFKAAGAFCKEGPQVTYLEMLKIADKKLYGKEHEQKIIQVFKNHGIEKKGKCMIVEQSVS